MITPRMGHTKAYYPFGELSLVPQVAAFHKKLLHCLLDSNSYCNSCTYHWVVTHTEEAHHLNVSRNRRRTCELSVRVHTTKSIGHTVRFLPHSRSIYPRAIRKSPYINKIRTPQNSSRLRLGLKICLLSVNGRS